jgi:hypothetical protein
MLRNQDTKNNIKETRSLQSTPEKVRSANHVTIVFLGLLQANEDLKDLLNFRESQVLLVSKACRRVIVEMYWCKEV